ncbi:MAG: hypothetical protein HY017_17530 [Betaproteobacteria bacterium]|nr:hypothetical protein [Betaproteobacteria bacterium]
MEILLGVLVVLVVLFALAIAIGKIKGPPDPQTQSDAWLQMRLGSEGAWINGYLRLSLDQQNESLKRMFDEKQEYIRQIESELTKRKSAHGLSATAQELKPILQTASEQHAPDGMSSKDKWLLEQTELVLAPLAPLIGTNVKPIARQFFEEMKADGIASYGDNIYSESYGDRIVTNQVVLAKRLAAGLTTDDVRNYWNKPVLLTLLHTKVRDFSEFCFIDVARQSGKDIVAVARDQRKRYPKYGDPEAWNPTLPANQGFTAEDADIYPEFILRVGQWQAQTAADEQAALLSQYTSFNAMIRALVNQGRLSLYAQPRLESPPTGLK